MAVEVINLRVMNNQLARAAPLIYKSVRVGLREAAEPVKEDAGKLSIEEFSGMVRARRKPPPWSIQKIGQTRSEVYMVPRQRGKRFYRTDGDRRRAEKFVARMMGRVYEPALSRNQARVRVIVETTLGKAIREI